MNPDNKEITSFEFYCKARRNTFEFFRTGKPKTSDWWWWKGKVKKGKLYRKQRHGIVKILRIVPTITTVLPPLPLRLYTSPAVERFPIIDGTLKHWVITTHEDSTGYGIYGSEHTHLVAAITPEHAIELLRGNNEDVVNGTEYEKNISPEVHELVLKTSETVLF